MRWGFSITSSRPAAGLRALLASLVLALLLGIPTAASAKEKATVVAASKAVIVANLTFIKVNDMVFGKIIPGTTAGTVVLSPAGVRSATGGVRLATGTLAQTAAFAGKGAVNQQVAISVTSNSVTLNRTGGGATMTMDTFIIGSTPTAQLTTNPLVFRIASTTGIFQFPVGATLRVNANQMAGIYTGNFSVSLNYQ